MSQWAATKSKEPKFWHQVRRRRTKPFNFRVQPTFRPRSQSRVPSKYPTLVGSLIPAMGRVQGKTRSNDFNYRPFGGNRSADSGHLEIIVEFGRSLATRRRPFRWSAAQVLCSLSSRPLYPVYARHKQYPQDDSRSTIVTVTTKPTTGLRRDQSSLSVDSKGVCLPNESSRPSDVSQRLAGRIANIVVLVQRLL
jgi:hypothetical protein